MRTVTKVNIDINRKNVCQWLGYHERSPSASVLSLIDSQIVEAYELINPVYTYELKAIEHVRGQEVSLGGSLVFTSKVVSYVLSDCKWVAVYLATIGTNLDERISGLIESRKVSEATILDAIGTEAIVQVFYKLQEVVKKTAKANGFQTTTIRYSPGYCDWHASQQKVLFRVIDSASVGVRLNENCMMIPQKSISGVTGIGTFEATKPPPCLVVCDKRASCTYKREGWDPEKQWLL